MTNGKTKCVMIQGTSSSAGKSILTAGFLRYFANKGVNCSPFKSQNMSLNSFITEDGSEIAVSQAVQSEAAFKKPIRQINPILIKPSSDTGMHLIIEGRHFGNMNFTEYNRKKDFFLKKAADSFDFLSKRNELTVVEGAGSPAEINLYKYDIVNMGFAEIYNIPVILTADIERGGVFASLYGTVKLLKPKWRKLVKGFIINKFRGDVSVLEPGIREIEQRLKIPCIGVMPYIKNIHIEAEDSLNLKNYRRNYPPSYSTNCLRETKTGRGCNAHGGRRRIERDSAVIKIGIVRLEHISNFNEFDPLFFDGRFDIVFFDEVQASVTEEFDMIIIPGTKSTASDLNAIKKSGVFDYIKRFERLKKGIIMGICGGFQMMGEIIKDPYMLETAAGPEYSGCITGFGFFNAETILFKKKVTVSRKYGFNGDFLDGYEIHNGRTFFSKNYCGGGIASDIFEPAEGKDAGGFLPEAGILSILSEDKRKIGTYVHGLFGNEIFKDFIIGLLNESVKNEKKKISFGDGEAGRRSYEAVKNDSFNLLSENIEKHINIELLESIAGI